MVSEYIFVSFIIHWIRICEVRRGLIFIFFGASKFYNTLPLFKKKSPLVQIIDSPQKSSFNKNCYPLPQL